MRSVQWVLTALLIAELLAFAAIWGVLWARYRRPGVPWYRAFERSHGETRLAWSDRHFVPAAARLRALGTRVQWALAATVLALVLVAAAQGRLVGGRP